MKKILLIILGIILGGAFSVQAATIPVSWFRDTVGGFVYPLISTDGLRVPSLGGNGTRCIQTDNDGDFSIASSACGSGGGSGGGTWSTTTSSVSGVLFNYPNNDSDVILIGSNSSTTAEYFFEPNNPTFPIHYKLLGNFLGNNSSTTIINLVSKEATSTNATTTNLNVSGTLDVDGLTSALTLTGATGIFAEYTGTTCTNQFVRVLSALGVATCESIGNEDFEDDDWGDITVASNVASVEDDSHAHTGATLSGIDISDDTNLTAGDNLTLTGDDIDLDATLTNMTAATFSGLVTSGNFLATGSSTLQNFTFVNATGTSATTTNFFATTASSTNLFVGNSISIFNSGAQTTLNGLCIQLTGSSALCDGTDATGSGGAAAVATSSAETATYVPFWTSTAGTPATLSGGVAGFTFDSSLARLTVTESIFTRSTSTQATSTNFFAGFLNANQLRIGQTATTTIDAEGDLALPAAGTFTIDSETYDSLHDDLTLANNAGDLQVVDVTCTDCLSSTEIDSTIAISARNLTIAGTANQITSSAGAQDLSADRTWTLSIPTDFRVSSTTISNLLVTGGSLFNTSTTTSATTTNLHVSGNLNFNGVSGSTWASFCTTITGGAGLCDGDDASGGGGNSKWATSTIDTLAIHTTDALRVGIGTTTPKWALQIASSTGPQLTLSDSSSITNNHWSLRNAGGLLYFATSSASTFATSSASVFSINANGFPTFSSLGSGAVTATNGLLGAGTLSVSNGGTGATTLTGILIGNGTSAFTADAVPLNVSNGGTGVTTFGGTDTLLFTTAADTLSSDSLFVYNSTRDNHGVGTSTPRWALQVASSTGPQLTLSDSSSITNNHWSVRNAGGNLYFATSSPTTFATTSANSITFAPAISGSAGLLIGTSTSGSTGLAVVGTVFMHALTSASGGSNNDLCISGTPNELIEETTGVCMVSMRASKHDIEPLRASLQTLMKLKPVSYSPNEDEESDYNDTLYGFVAEDLAEADPHLARYGIDGKPRTIDDWGILSLVVNSIQDVWREVVNLIDWNKDQEARILELEKKNLELENRLKALEND